MYFKQTLDKLGVKAEVIHAGKYKDAGDIFTQTSMSPETREVLNAILDQYYGNLIATVAEGRKKPPDAVRALIDDGPFLARDALSGRSDRFARLRGPGRRRDAEPAEADRPEDEFGQGLFEGCVPSAGADAASRSWWDKGRSRRAPATRPRTTKASLVRALSNC